MRKQSNSRKQNGFSILEVVIGIFIFIVGMLALASLQGALTRSMADSKLRTTAVNIADSVIESQRGFSRLQLDTSGAGLHSYNAIVSDNDTVTVSGVTYSIDLDVRDYYYHLNTDTFTEVSTGAAASDYKQVEVTVTWNAGQDLFRGDEGDEVDLGSGEVTLTAAIPAIVTSVSGRVADETTGGTAVPPILYTPGLNPDIIALSLGDSKFKESTTPQPDVIRRDSLVQTTFDVITYSSNNGNSFLRREEFAAVSCECTYNDADSDNPGRRPVIWAGDEYDGGHYVEKPYGESANNQQSSLCDSCCRDHHDGGSSTEDSSDAYANVFGPFRSDGTGTEATEYSGTARASDHLHYQDDMSVAGDGDEYLEVCRLVRVDGYFRVAQDFRREDKYILPPDFLDDPNSEPEEFTTYSGYVTGATEAYLGVAANGYPSSGTPPPCIGGSSPCVAEPTMQGAYSTARGSGEFPSWTTLVTDADEQKQLRSRGIYIDYMSNDLRLFLTSCFEVVDGADTLKDDCCIRAGSVASACTADDLYIDRTATANPLEVIPFFDVQMTKLENWDQTVQNTLPISLTNEALADANAHSRGEIEQIVVGATDVDTESHRGNIGFTNTLAIDPVFETTFASLNVQSLDSGGAGGGGGGTPPIVIEGTFTESVRGNPTIEVVGNGDATCTLTANGYTCSVDAAATSASVTVSGYRDDRVNPAPENRFACSGDLEKINSQVNPRETWAEFDLFDSSTGAVLPSGTTYDITIQLSDC